MGQQVGYSGLWAWECRQRPAGNTQETAGAVGGVVQDVYLPVAYLKGVQQLQGLLNRSGRASPAPQSYLGPLLSWQDEGNLLEWEEKCQLVGSGDAPIDDDCLLSPVEHDMGAPFDQYHGNCFMSLSRAWHHAKDTHFISLSQYC